MIEVCDTNISRRTSIFINTILYLPFSIKTHIFAPQKSRDLSFFCDGPIAQLDRATDF
jgi:hypothetical protein